MPKGIVLVEMILNPMMLTDAVMTRKAAVELVGGMIGDAVLGFAVYMFGSSCMNRRWPEVLRVEMVTCSL